MSIRQLRSLMESLSVGFLKNVRVLRVGSGNRVLVGESIVAAEEIAKAVQVMDRVLYVHNGIIG